MTRSFGDYIFKESFYKKDDIYLNMKQAQDKNNSSHKGGSDIILSQPDIKVFNFHFGEYALSNIMISSDGVFDRYSRGVYHQNFIRQQ